MSGGRGREREGTGEEGRGEISLRAALNGPGLAEGVDAVMASEPARPRLLLINHFPSAVVPSIPSIHPSSVPLPLSFPSLLCKRRTRSLVVVVVGALFKILTMLPPSLLWSSSAAAPSPLSPSGLSSSSRDQRGFLCQREGRLAVHWGTISSDFIADQSGSECTDRARDLGRERK